MTSRVAAAASRRRSARSSDLSPVVRDLLPLSGTQRHFCRRSPRNNLACGPPARIHHLGLPSWDRREAGVRRLHPELQNRGVPVLLPTRPRHVGRPPASVHGSFHDWLSLPLATLPSTGPPPSRTESVRPTSSPDRATPDCSAPLAATQPRDGMCAALRSGRRSDSTADWAPRPARTPS